MIKKKLDIEKLLQWAYRDELPKTSSSPTPTAWLAQFVGDAALAYGAASVSLAGS